MVNINGKSILSTGEKKQIIKEFFPLAYLLILNTRDIEEILDIKIDETSEIEDIAIKIKKLGPVNILIRNLKVSEDEVDILYDGEELTYFKGEKSSISDTYIIGEKMSAAIAANVAKGASLKNAIKKGKEYIREEEIKIKSRNNGII